DKRHYEQFADGTVKDIEDEIPFEVPEGWAWCRLGEICSKLVDGDHNPPKGINEKTEYLMISSRNINHNQVEDLENVRYLTKDIFDTENKRTNLQVGDILFTSVGSLGRSCVYAGGLNLCFQRSVTIIHTNQYNFWLKYYFDSDYYQAYILDNATGTAQLGFYLQQMEKSFIPLPPLAEQERIVSVIKSIFSQIDTLDQNKSDLQTAIKQAKSKILDLAIHGKLVSQDPNDEPAEELLKRIATSDNRPYEKFKESEKLFEAPENWSWCYLKETCTDFIVPQRDKPKVFDGTIPWCRIEDIEGKYLNGSLSKQLVSKDTIKQMNMHICPVGSVICSCSASLGIQAITTIECCTNQTFIGIVPIESVLYNEYLFYYLKAQTKYFHKIATGTTIKYISRDKFEELPFALPPFEEQKRIVSKIENLFTVLDEIVLNLV
ncbi:MAG: restriction endonuclease subunit S, partial [Bacilli bacterium]|nr:restriction endonuclease subunit S [Bacilli bacterium]